jgi:hypothetical protein
VLEPGLRVAMMAVTELKWGEPKGWRYHWHRLRGHLLHKEAEVNLGLGPPLLIWEHWYCATCHRTL